MKLDATHLIPLAIGLALGYFVLPMAVAWIAGKK